MMKAAQAPGVGGLPLGGPNQGSHSPQHQNMHGGKLKIDTWREYYLNLFTYFHCYFFKGPGNGSSSGSPSNNFLPPGHSPTPSSTPVSELSPGNIFV